MAARWKRVTEDDDRALIARVGAGDRAAFGEFYERYVRRILAFVSDLIADRALAEEVTGDVMLAVWRGAHRFSGRSRVSTWVLGIAHHKAVDAHRRVRTPPVLESSELQSIDCDPATITIRALDRAALDTALASLTPQHREVLQLMFGFECSQAEIAEIMAIPIATVKTRAFYAKRRLRDALEAQRASEHTA